MGLFTSKKIRNDVYQSPGNANILNLLGVGDFQYSTDLGLRRTRESRSAANQGLSPSSNNVFDAGALSKIQQFLGGGDRPEYLDQDAESLAKTIAPAVRQSQAFFSSDIAPALRDLVNTGFRTNTAGIREGALRGFRSDTLPTAFEQLSAYGVGLGSSGAQETVGRLAGDLEAELAGFEFSADEAASGRRVAGIPLASQLFDINSIRGLAGAQGLNEVANLVEGSSEGGRLFEALLALSGSLGQGQPIVQGYAPSKGEQIFGAVNNAFSTATGGMMGGMGGMGGGG